MVMMCLSMADIWKPLKTKKNTPEWLTMLNLENSVLCNTDEIGESNEYKNKILWLWLCTGDLG